MGLRDKAKIAALEFAAKDGLRYERSEAANAASDVWEPVLKEAIALLEKYERAMWIKAHGDLSAYRDSHDLWTLKDKLNG